MSNPTVNFCVLENSHDNDVSRPVECTWEKFLQDFGGHNIIEIKDSWMFSPWIYKTPTGGRNSDNCVGTNLLFLDFDKDSMWTIEDAKQVFAKYTYFLYTTFSHQKVDKDSFRVVLPLVQTIATQDLSTRRKAIVEKYIGVDPSCLHNVHNFYIPLCPAERKELAVTHSNIGELFDILAFEQEAPYVPPKNVVHVSIDNKKRQWIIENLKQCYVGNDKEWFKLGCGLVAGGFTSADFIYASVNGLMHEKDAKACMKKWTTCQKIVKSKGGSLGTVINFLKSKKLVYEEWNENEDSEPNPIKEFVQARKEALPVDYPEHHERFTPWQDTPSQSEPPLIEYEEQDIVHPFNQAKRKQMLKEKVVGMPHRVTLLEAFEGFGKSYCADLLVQKRNKVLFCCSSNKQAIEQCESFTSRNIRAQVILSKTHILEHRYGIEIQTDEAAHPWIYDKFNSEKTKQWCKSNINRATKKVWTDQEIEQAWIDSKEDKPNWEQYDVVCTTIDRALVYGKIQYARSFGYAVNGMQDRFLSPAHRLIPKGGYVFFDDPHKKFFTRLYPYIEEKHKDLEIDGVPVKVIDLNNKKYLVRPPQFTLGWGLFSTNWIFTTTEILTTYLIKNIYKDVYHPKLMPDKKMDAGNITMIKTNIVRKKSDGFLIPINKRLEKQGYEYIYIANGQGAEHNLESTKGQNTFTDKDTLIEISMSHYEQVQKYIDELRWDSSDQFQVQLVLALDDLQQAIGRNSGYRYSDNDSRCRVVVLAEPQLFDSLIKAMRYHVRKVINDVDDVIGLKPEYTNYCDGVCWFIRNLDRYLISGTDNQPQAFINDVRESLTQVPTLKKRARAKRLKETLETRIKGSSNFGFKQRLNGYLAVVLGYLE
jgi:hypothetical protein